MIPEKLNIYEYEELLTDQKQSFKHSFKNDDSGNKKEVGVIWKYAIEKILNWTPKEALTYLTPQIAEQFCLDKTLIGIGVNDKKNFISNYAFILQYAYPDIIKYDFYDETIEVYLKSAHLGPYKNDTDDIRLPKKFFSDDYGFDRADILLNYVVNLWLSGMSISELYEFFAQTNKAKSFLKSKKLGLVLRVLYDTPLEYFHNSISGDKKDDLIYYNIVLREAVNKK